MYVFFTERQSECPKLAADILRKIENHFARSARRIRIVKNREKEMATVSPLRNAGASLSAQRFGRNRRQFPDFHPVGCFWRHLLALKGGRTHYKRIPEAGISPIPDRTYILRTFGLPRKYQKVKYGELSTALGAVDSRNRKSLRCRRLFRGGWPQAGCSDAVRSEDELFEFQFAQFVEPRNEGREMRGRLMGGERLGVAPCLADHQYVGARGALEQIVGDAARVFERSRYQFLGRGDRLFTVGRRRADKYIESYHSRYVFEFCTNSL